MPRILVIEDDANIRTLLATILTREGYTVTQAENGKIGVESYRKDPPDLVITDMIMPEMEGAETILNIRSDNPDAKIIAISGGGISVNTSTCLLIGKMMGAVRTLNKPFTKSDILDAVRDSLAEPVIE